MGVRASVFFGFRFEVCDYVGCGFVQEILYDPSHLLAWNLWCSGVVKSCRFLQVLGEASLVLG